jgi:hypothetical protein
MTNAATILAAFRTIDTDASIIRTHPDGMTDIAALGDEFSVTITDGSLTWHDFSGDASLGPIDGSRIASALKRRSLTDEQYLALSPAEKIDVLAYLDAAGIYRWHSNDAVPFADMLTDAGVSADTIERCVTVRRAEDTAAIQRYREARRNRAPEQRAEEMFEMRAAFGPGEKVVDVFTGETFTT